MRIVEKRHGVRRIVAHVGSAHNDAELAVLLASARDRITQVNRYSTCPQLARRDCRVRPW